MEKKREKWMCEKERRDGFKNENSKRLSHLSPVPWRNVVLMINAQSLVCFQHLEQQLNRDIEDKSSVETVERHPAPLMLKPYLFKICYKSLTLAKLESDLH